MGSANCHDSKRFRNTLRRSSLHGGVSWRLLRMCKIGWSPASPSPRHQPRYWYGRYRLYFSRCLGLRKRNHLLQRKCWSHRRYKGKIYHRNLFKYNYFPQRFATAQISKFKAQLYFHDSMENHS